MDHLDDIYDAIIDGDKNGTVESVKAALADGLSPKEILNDGMIAAMDEVGRLFEETEIFVPEMLVAARAMKAGLELLRPYLVKSGIEPAGKVVLGTVQGDMHDIGKNLVGMMLEGAGFEIVDLGVDVAPEKFIEALQGEVDILGMSALLTTTMVSMEKTVKAIEAAGLRHKAKIMVGGAPVTEEFAKHIGVDGYAGDASQAVTVAKALLA
ncbi:MAG: corrinoid protein [Ardenticatenaceae bacterium]|nr:corrinoid protein [Ardenticatenaceae bacterium]MCB8948611.1 corrinoid protein [Ardenticatenaceae bacterium]